MTSAELALVVVSALLHALWSASIKGSRSALGFNLLQLAPTFVAALLLPIWVSPAAIPREVWWIVAGTGVFHGLYFYWLSRALETGELSVVYPIARSAPAFLPLAAVPLLGESISPTGAIGIVVVVAGMWMSADVRRPPFPGSEPKASGESQNFPRSEPQASGEIHKTRAPSSMSLAPGVAYALLTLIASVGYSLCDKAGMARLAAAPWGAPIPPVVVYYLLLCNAGAIVFAPLALRRVSLRELRALARVEWRTAFVAAAISAVGYGLILQALRTAPVSYVVTARQTSVLFAVAIAAVRLRERPTRLRLIGALATVVGVALVAR